MNEQPKQYRDLETGEIIQEGAAPKDGTWILAWYPNRSRAEMARWESEKYHKNPKPYWLTAVSWGVIENRNNPPSHWQPLPEGPRE